MRILSRIAVVAALFALLATAAPAAEHTVDVRSNSFTPRDLVIEVGDTVTWVNRGGLHNVQADDGSFRCANGCDGMSGNGNAASNAWSVSLTFNDSGFIDYFCEVHVSLGMTGSLTINEKAAVPGTLGFSQSSRNVGEGDGSVTLTVNRTGGSDGAVSVGYMTSNGSATAGNDYITASDTLNWIDGDGASKTFQVQILDDGDDENDETFNVMLLNPSGGAGIGFGTATVTIEDDDEPSSEPEPGRIQFASSVYNVDEDDGSATITVTRRNGSDGAVSVDYETFNGSAEDGSDYSGRSDTLTWVNGNSATKSFTVPITDDGAVEGDETVNLMLSNPGGGATLGSSSATLTIEDDDSPPSEGCVRDDETLCLNRDDRFEATVVWSTLDESGVGKAVDIGKRDSGLFYFFAEDNIEMLVKVLRGCSIGKGRFWVFFAATTDVEFTLTVTDTQENVTKTYRNPLGQAANAVTDTDAFATCP